MERITRCEFVFRHSFTLGGAEELPAGTYSVETVEERLDGASFSAFRRLSTTIVLAAGAFRQVTEVDPAELAAAHAADGLR